MSNLSAGLWNADKKSAEWQECNLEVNWRKNKVFSAHFTEVVESCALIYCLQKPGKTGEQCLADEEETI